MRGKRLFPCAFGSLVVLLIAQSASLRSQSVDASSPPVAPVKPVTDDY